MRKVSPELLANLDWSHAWRASLSAPCGKIDEMSLIPHGPNPFVRGLASIAGDAATLTSPATHRLTRCSTPCGQGYTVAQHGTGLAGADQKRPPEKRRKKTPATLKA